MSWFDTYGPLLLVGAALAAGVFYFVTRTGSRGSR